MFLRLPICTRSISLNVQHLLPHVAVEQVQVAGCRCHAAVAGDALYGV